MELALERSVAICRPDQTSRMNAELERSEYLELHCLLLLFSIVDNITLMMFVLNFVEFCFILELIYSSDFHEGRQYFMLMLVLNFF